MNEPTSYLPQVMCLSSDRLKKVLANPRNNRKFRTMSIWSLRNRLLLNRTFEPFQFGEIERENIAVDRLDSEPELLP